MKMGVEKKKKIVIRFILVSIVLCIIFFFVNQFVRVKNKQDEIKKIKEEILVEESKKQKILGMLDEKGFENIPENSSVEEDETSNGSVRVFESVIK